MTNVKNMEEVLLAPSPERAESVSVKLSPKSIEILDAIADKSGKSRGIAAKLMLEQSIIDMGKAWGFLPDYAKSLAEGFQYD